MAQIYTVLSGKGGVGKSTFCVNTALSLCEKGKRVLLIDGDVGFRSLDLLLGVDEMVLYDWGDILNERCEPHKARLFYDESLQLLPAPIQGLDSLKKADFQKLLDIYKAEYDYIFIDAPAGINDLGLIYSQCANTCVVVVTPDNVSTRSACTVGEVLLNNGIKEEELRLIINRFNKQAIKKGRLLNIDEVIDKTYIRLLGVVPEESSLMYYSVSENTLSPYCDAKTAFNNIADRISGKEIPLYL